MNNQSQHITSYAEAYSCSCPPQIQTHKRAESNQSFSGRVQRRVCLREQSTVSRHGGAKTGALRLSGTLDDLANELAESAGMYAGGIMRERGTGVLMVEVVR